MRGRVALVFATAGFLAGCVSQSETYLPDGSRGYAISCHGAMQSMSACLERAGQLCRSQGYRVFDRSGQAIPVGSFTANSTGAAGFMGSAIYRDILIGCGTGQPAPQAAPGAQSGSPISAMGSSGRQ